MDALLAKRLVAGAIVARKTMSGDRVGRINGLDEGGSTGDLGSTRSLYIRPMFESSAINDKAQYCSVNLTKPKLLFKPKKLILGPFLEVVLLQFESVRMSDLIRAVHGSLGPL
jgi:hypothetical protein